MYPYDCAYGSAPPVHGDVIEFAGAKSTGRLPRLLDADQLHRLPACLARLVTVSSRAQVAGPIWGCRIRHAFGRKLAPEARCGRGIATKSDYSGDVSAAIAEGDLI